MMAGIASREKRHALADRKDDFYATPIEAVRALMAVEALPQNLWEPACGDGAIVKPLREADYTVYATDLVDRGCPRSISGVDFLMETNADTIDGIVTNPPFKLATEFVAKAVSLVPYVAILARLSFLEGSARKLWFEASPLARVHVSSKRLPMMHRGGWEGEKAGSAICFAWFVWDRRHIGPPHIHWFDWREYS